MRGPQSSSSSGNVVGWWELLLNVCAGGRLCKESGRQEGKLVSKWCCSYYRRAAGRRQGATVVVVAVARTPFAIQAPSLASPAAPTMPERARKVRLCPPFSGSKSKPSLPSIVSAAITTHNARFFGVAVFITLCGFNDCNSIPLDTRAALLPCFLEARPRKTLGPSVTASCLSAPLLLDKAPSAERQAHARHTPYPV